ncbi:MAG: hypothetical protein AAGA20_24540, partial [Planctomycetota bacterium]
MPTSRAALAIALVAASGLVYEILLTRVAALRLAFHFSFLVVSGALFAVGVAGAFLTIVRSRTNGNERRWAATAAALAGVALPITYAFLLTWPVPAQFRIGDLESTLRVAVLDVGAAVPFALAGAAIGLILQARADDVHRVYAADLVGASLGCVATPLVLWQTGAGGALAVATALAFAGASVLAREEAQRKALGTLAALSVAAVPFLDDRFPVPSKAELALTEDSVFLAGEERLASRWSALSRIDVDRVAPDQRSLFLRPPNVPMPRPEEQAFIMQDGSAGTYVHDYSGTPEALEGLQLSLYALASRILLPKDVFVIGAGGGDDLWAAKAVGANKIKAVELNRAIVELHRGLFADWSRDLLEDPGVELVNAEGRSALLSETDRYDLLQMSGIDTWTALQSGAYMLAENFLYTRDAVRDMVAILRPGGALQITRFSGDIEALRLLATMRSVHAELGEGRFHECVACVPAGAFLAIVMKRQPFTDEEVARLDRFLSESGASALAHPRRPVGGSVDAFVRTEDPAAMLANAPMDLRPVTDDRPYFFHFHRWNDLGRARQDLDAPTVVTQGNPLFLLGQLVLAIVAALVILLPTLRFALRSGPGGAAGAPSVFAYFGAVGAGYVVIQVALLQKLVLLVGHPQHSLTVTLFTMLLATGAGAYLSRNAFGAGRPPRRLWLVPIGVAVVVALLSTFGADLTRGAATLAAPARFALAGAIVAPVGLLLGIPFAHGIAAIEERRPALVPWAWAANASTTVVGSIVCVIVSINFGFDA